MLTPTVVKHLDLVNEVITGCLTRPIIPLRRALALQAAKKPRRDRLVSTRPLATPAARHPRGRPHPAVGMAGRLSTTITLGSQASTGLATAPRPLQGLTHPRRSARRAHRPPHHLSRRQLHQPRRIPPACRGPDVRHLTAPRPLGRHASTGALPQMRRHPLPRTTRRRLWPTTAAARDRHAGLWHATAGCPATDGLARLLARRAQAPTAITVRRLRSQRRETREEIDLCTPERRHRLAPVVGIQAAAPTSPHVTPPRHRPGRRVVGNARVLHRDSWAKNGGPASRSHAPGATASPLCTTAGVLRARRSGDRCRPCSRWCATRRDASSAPASWHCSPGCARLP